MAKDKPKVLYLSNIPSPYMLEYLDELGKYCDVSVVFEKETDGTRPDSWRISDSNSNRKWRFKYKILKGVSISAVLYGDRMGYAPDDKAFSPSVTKYIRKDKYNIIIVANPCTPTGIWAIIFMKMKKIPFCIQSEGGIPGSGKGIKEKIKKFLMKDADIYFSTCELDDRYFYTYGADESRIRRYVFASIKEKNLPSKFITDDERKKYKEKLGIKTKRLVLAVGRSVEVKGFDILLNADSFIKTLDVTIGFVGGKCIDEYAKIIKDNNLKNVFFRDNVEFDVLKEYYYAADVFVLPTRGDTWGLVINEAMTFGLPVITTETCVAGNALIKDCKNGFIVPVENPIAISEKIDYILDNPEERNKMSHNNFIAMRNWTYEEMARGMDKHIREIVSINE